MNIGELIDKLEDIELEKEYWYPEIFIKIGDEVIKASNVKYYPRTDFEEESIIIS